jgi:xylan 1,4-beta-xylosidase
MRSLQKFLICVGLVFIGLQQGRAADEAGTPIAVKIQVDAAKPIGALQPMWRFFGADEPNYAYMKDGKKLLQELGELGKPQVYFRTHNLLTTGDGTPALKWGSTNAYREDAEGKPIYDWTITDRIFDTYLTNNVKPYVQMGFMPEAMSTKPDPYQHKWAPKARYDEIYTGWAYPPKDFKKWEELCYQWAKHCVDKYGKEEVEKWYWETWNEADIGYWRGTREQFYELHDRAVAGVRRALPTARVGGPDAAGQGTYVRQFLEHCLRGKNFATGEVGTPIDFISFHAKGAPTFVDGHVRMGIANQLRAINTGFGVVASFPELKSTPIIIGESDPDGCAACQGPQLGYRNTTMFSSYTASVFARKWELADKHGVNLEGALTWAFTFEDQPLFAGFRQLASGGIDMPVLNVFRMFGKMSGQRVNVASDKGISTDEIIRSVERNQLAGVRGEPDINALASLDKNKLCVMVWYYHDDDLAGPVADINISLAGIPFSKDVRVEEFRIDTDHSNAYTVWQKMESPEKPNAEQYSKLEKAGQLASMGEAKPLTVADGKANLKVSLPRQGVALFVVKTTDAEK